MRARTRRSVIVATAVAATLAAAGTAYAVTAQPAISTSTPHSADQVTNIDVLRQQIRNYYGDPLGTGVFDPQGNYAKEASAVADSGAHWLAAKQHDHGHWAKGDNATKAIVLDVDDTTLTTWNYELVSNWAYNPTTNADYVNGQLFPATPGMVAMATAAAQEGYAVFYLTGRPTSQEAATLGNLTADGIGVDAGYPAPTALNDGEDGLFTKPDVSAYPDYLKAACAADPGGKCTTIHYKSATRAHIESLGYDIVANFGDQYSDLKGGSADRTFKMPNPNYYLP
ncbi:HAD family acid phosphatase [Cellulomonas sp. McL0617]|uniref:HAD family acid phosphatase n=1 Tax=Cellulomonas sp. McL0617 TaxID=3415675 RepID=UPI003CE76704